MQYVILGANGYLGSYLYKRFLEDNYDVIGTCHKRIRNSQLIYYDVLKDDIGEVVSKMSGGDWLAIICFAKSNIDECYVDYECAYNLNVTTTKKIVKEIQHRNGRVLFFSSDNVFDGTRGNYTEKDITNAINCYGKMKEEIEQYILNLQNTCVYRLSKVVGDRATNQNLFFAWQTQIKKNEKIKCIKNNCNSFVCDEDVYQACMMAGENKMSGLYNIAGNKAWDRSELAIKFVSHLGKGNIEVEECDLPELGLKDNRPLNVSLSNKKFVQDTDYAFATMEEVIAEYIKRNKLRA